MTRRVLKRVTPISAPYSGWDWAAAFDLCLRVARRTLWSLEAAEDAAQAALERALMSERTRDDLDDPDAWLARIADREACRIMRRELLIRLRTTGAQELELVAVPDREIVRVEAHLVFESMIAPLTPGDRHLIRLKYDADLTLRAIANRLGILEGNAKVRLHRALEKLRDES